jgi:hypothetical protein
MRDVRDPREAAGLAEAALGIWATTALAMRELAVALRLPLHGVPAGLGRLWLAEPDPRLHGVLGGLQATASTVARAISGALAGLPPQERRAASWWWGTDDAPPASVEAVAARCGYSHGDLARHDLERAWGMLFGAAPLPAELEWAPAAPAELAWPDTTTSGG